MNKEKLKWGLGICGGIAKKWCIECPYMSAYDGETNKECTTVLTKEALQYITYLEKKGEYLEYFLNRQNEDNKSTLGPMAWDDIVWWVYNATEVDKIFTIKELKERFPRLLGHIEEE